MAIKLLNKQNRCNWFSVNSLNFHIDDLSNLVYVQGTVNYSDRT